MNYSFGHNAYLRMGGKFYPKEAEKAFESALVHAIATIRTATHGRLDNMQHVESVENIHLSAVLHYLLFELIENFGAYATRYGTSSKSQSVDGLSENETYKTVAEREAEVDALLVGYLGGLTDDDGTPLLYRGCSV